MFVPDFITLDPPPGPYGEYSLLPGQVNVHTLTVGRWVGQHIQRSVQDLSVRYWQSPEPHGVIRGEWGSLWREPLVLEITEPGFITMENLINSPNLYVWKLIT